MPYTLAISGSSVLSQSDKLPNLFAWGLSAIEAGGFSSRADFEYVLAECRRRSISFGLHAPLDRYSNRYGLLRGEEDAWAELEQDLQTAKQAGLNYAVVHIPYLQPGVDIELAKSQLQSAVERFHVLRRKYGVPIVAEPKLGPGQDPGGFALLLQYTPHEIADWQLPICLDVGDIYLAAPKLGVDYMSLVKHFASSTTVVHLHDVVVSESTYFWTPVTANSAVPIIETLCCLPYQLREIVAVLEHTPHLVESGQQVREGLMWLQQQLALL